MLSKFSPPLHGGAPTFLVTNLHVILLGQRRYLSGFSRLPAPPRAGVHHDGDDNGYPAGPIPFVCGWFALSAFSNYADIDLQFGQS